MKRIALLSGSLLLKAVLNFAALVLFARILSPAEYGVYALINTLVLLVDALGFAWLRFSFIRFDAAQDASAHGRAMVGHIGAVYGGTAAVCLLVGGLAMGATWAGYSLVGLSAPLWLVVGGMMAGEGLFNLQLTHANNMRREVDFLALTTVRSLGGLFFGWGLVSAGWGVAGVLWGQLGAYALAAALMGWPRFRLHVPRVWPLQSGVLRTLLTFGLPLAVMGGLDMAITALHRTLVFHLLGAEVLGVYAVSNDLVQKLLVFVMLTLNTAMLPIVVQKLEREGQRAAQAQLRKNAVILVGLGLPAVVGMALLAPHMALVFLGASYQTSAAELLPWFSVAALFKGVGAFYLVHAFYLSKTNHRLMVPMALLAGASVVLCYGAIQVAGLKGAMAANLLTWGGYALMVGVLGRARFPLPLPWRSWGLVALATGAMAGAVWFVRPLGGLPGLLVASTTGTIAYAILLLALNLENSRTLLFQTLHKAHQKGARLWNRS